MNVRATIEAVFEEELARFLGCFATAAATALQKAIATGTANGKAQRISGERGVAALRDRRAEKIPWIILRGGSLLSFFARFFHADVGK